MTKRKNRTQYINKKIKENYDQLRVVVPKGQKQGYKDYAEKTGKSLNGLVNELLENEVNKSGNSEP